MEQFPLLRCGSNWSPPSPFHDASSTITCRSEQSGMGKFDTDCSGFFIYRRMESR